MTRNTGVDRRAFLRGAGMTAIAGATGAVGAAVPAAALAADGDKGRNGKYDFDNVVDRIGANHFKTDGQIKKFGKEYFDLGMGVADMDFYTAPVITEALHEEVDRKNWGYIAGTDSLKEAIVQWNKERYGVDVPFDAITMSSGVHNGLISALNEVARPGTKTLVTTPTYNGFYGDTRLSRTIAVDNEMYVDDDGKYHMDWDDFEAKLTPDCQAFLLCNPQNPTGNCWSEEDLLRMGELCLKNDVVVLADEIHRDFIMAGQKYVPFSTLPDKAIVDNSLTFAAISKTFSLAGMKNAFFWSTNPTLLERVRWMHRADMNTLGVVANEAAYRHGAPWFDQLLTYIDENHNYVENYVKERMPGVKYKKAEGTYLAWLDVSDPVKGLNCAERAEREGLESAEHYFEKWLVEQAHVQLNPGSNYGTGGAGHMRMNLGTSLPNIKAALDEMSSALRTA